MRGAVQLDGRVVQEEPAGDCIKQGKCRIALQQYALAAHSSCSIPLKHRVNVADAVSTAQYYVTVKASL